MKKINSTTKTVTINRVADLDKKFQSLLPFSLGSGFGRGGLRSVVATDKDGVLTVTLTMGNGEIDIWEKGAKNKPWTVISDTEEQIEWARAIAVKKGWIVLTDPK